MAAYVHAFGLLAFKTLYPKAKPYIDDMITKLTAEGSILPSLQI